MSQKYIKSQNTNPSNGGGDNGGGNGDGELDEN